VFCSLCRLVIHSRSLARLDTAKSKRKYSGDNAHNVSTWLRMQILTSLTDCSARLASRNLELNQYDLCPESQLDGHEDNELFLGTKTEPIIFTRSKPCSHHQAFLSCASSHPRSHEVWNKIEGWGSGDGRLGRLGRLMLCLAHMAPYISHSNFNDRAR